MNGLHVSVAGVGYPLQILAYPSRIIRAHKFEKRAHEFENRQLSMPKCMGGSWEGGAATTLGRSLAGRHVRFKYDSRPGQKTNLGQDPRWAARVAEPYLSKKQRKKATGNTLAVVWCTPGGARSSILTLGRRGRAGLTNGGPAQAYPNKTSVLMGIRKFGICGLHGIFDWNCLLGIQRKKGSFVCSILHTVWLSYGGWCDRHTSPEF